MRPRVSFRIILLIRNYQAITQESLDEIYSPEMQYSILMFLKLMGSHSGRRETNAFRDKDLKAWRTILNHSEAWYNHYRMSGEPRQ